MKTQCASSGLTTKAPYKPAPAKARVRHVTCPIRREMKRRAAVEPVIGHLKAEHRMGRNHLKGRDGDRANPVLAAPDTTSPSCCAGSGGCCAPSSRRSSHRQSASKIAKNHHSAILHRRRS
jgi:IS5 family transposase